MRWFILRIKTKRTDRIVETLGADRCWVATEKRWTKPAKKHSPVLSETPLLPGWLFVRESEHGKWLDLDGVYGVVNYGKQGTLWIEDQDLDGLRTICAEVPDRPSPPKPDKPRKQEWRPKVGDRVELRGLMAGVKGTVCSIKDGKDYEIDTGNFLVWSTLRLLKPLKP